MNILILVGGKSHSGKGTFSENLETILLNKRLNLNVIRCSLSTYIRKITKEDFYWDGNDSSEVRNFMGEVYRLGTKIYPYHMARRVWERDIVPSLTDSFNIIIIESFRELNNYIYFKELEEKKLIDKIITINIERPNFNDITKDMQKHISETDLDNFAFDYTIVNDKNVSDLSNKIKTFTNDLIKNIISLREGEVGL